MEPQFKALPFQIEDADIEIINYIRDHGFKFFVEYARKVAGDKTGNETDKRYYTTYLRMYLFNECSPSIFSPETDEADADADTDAEVDIWNTVVDVFSGEPPNSMYGVISFLSNEEQVLFIDKFLGTVILDIDGDRSTVNNMFLDRNITKLIAKSSKLQHIIMYYADRKEINDILFCLIGNKSCREPLYKTLDDIGTKYIHTNHPHTLTPVEFREIGNIKRRLLGIATALMEIYFGGNTPQKVGGFKLLPKTTTEATPLNNMFWFIHSFLSISYHSIGNYKKVLGDFINTLEEKLEELQQLDTPDAPEWISANIPVQITGVKTQISQVKAVLNTINVLITSNITELIRKFYCGDTLYWFSCQREIERQDMTDNLLSNIFDFVNFVKMPFLQSNSMVKTEDFCEFIMRAIKTDNKITGSASVKGTLISICINDALWKFGRRPKVEYLKEFVRCYIYLHEKSEDFEYAIDLYTIANTFVEDDDYCFTDYLLTYGLRDEVENLVHVLVDNLYSSQNDVFTILKKMNGRQNATGDYEGEEPDEEIDMVHDYHAIRCGMMLKFSTTLKTLIKFILRKDASLVFGVATRDKFVMYLLWSIDEMIGSNRGNLKVRNFPHFDATLNLVSLYEIFTLAYPNSNFRKSLVNETRFLNFSYFRKMGKILYEHKKSLLNQEYITFNNSINELEEAHKLLNDIDLDEVPDDFLDPIMGTLIDDPVMLPECETIMNRDIIYRHVLAEKNNPFNRKELTIGDLESFNALEDTKNKITVFNERKAECLRELSSS